MTDRCETCFFLHFHRTGTRADNVGITIASPALFTWPNHPLVLNDPVVLNTSGVLATGLIASKMFFAIPVDAATFQVAATRDGAAINTSGSQSGVHSVDLVVMGCHQLAPNPDKSEKALWRKVDFDYWCGQFAEDYASSIQDALNVALSQIAAAAAQTAITTGDAKLTLKTTADTGYVMMDDGTIGSATSGASTRADGDCQALFTLLWNNIDNTGAPVVTGRGATAAADWSANKKITLTRQLGRAIAIAGAGSALTARTLGRFDGAETHALTTAEAAVLTNNPDTTAVSQVWDGVTPILNVVTASGGASYTGAPGAAHSIMNPRSYWNVMLKL